MELFVWFLFVVCFLFAVRIFVVVLGRDALMARPLRSAPVWHFVVVEVSHVFHVPFFAKHVLREN
jgi:hypothetical protein